MINYLKNLYHYFLAWLGNLIYWFPSRKIFVLGITGTKGKSTTIELINAILESAGQKTALLSSLRFKIGEENKKNMTSMTMPGRFFIQRFLRKAVNANCRYALIEVTSQGILQHRHRFIDFDAALFTNVQPEHIEAHGSFENYRDIKTSFFHYISQKSQKNPKLFFINDDDPSKSYFSHAVNGSMGLTTGGSGKVIYFSRSGFIENDLAQSGITDWLNNNFNLENAAAAVAFIKSQNIGWDLIRKSLSSFRGIPGRLETIRETPFRVVIDYAHTPDSLAKVYEALTAKSSKSRTRNSKLICVLGAAGGGRDKWKRPVMGRIAAEYCKAVILTNEDPYDEQPEQILSDIESGLPQSTKYWKILDRKEAIKKALSLAKPDDAVIITGKGSESWMHLARGKRIAWDEHKIITEILKK